MERLNLRNFFFLIFAVKMHGVACLDVLAMSVRLMLGFMLLTWFLRATAGKRSESYIIPFQTCSMIPGNTNFPLDNNRFCADDGVWI